MKNIKTPFINGKFLYYAFIAGGNQILKNQVEINRINIFPVNDKDTGTNLASTVRSVIDNIKPHKSYKTTVSNIADAALIGARGNSGVIFAQFLHGLNRETINKPIITLNEFAESVKKSIPYIYEAVANPIEGTMLTVIKEWSDFLNSKKDAIYDFADVIIDSFAVLEKSLAETNTKLKALSKSDFVDAGAKGFVLFMEGIIGFIKNRNIRNLVVDASENISLVHSYDLTEDEISFRFCTEAIIKNMTQSKSELQKFLSQNGDSVVVAGSESICRIHVHTNKPAELFHQLKEVGTITFQKVDDMVRQQEAVSKRKWNIALVTDSTCDLSQDLIDLYQINMVPINLNFGDSHYLDKVTIQPNQFYDLLDTESEFPKTSQINEQTFTNLYSHLASHYDAIIAVHLSGQFSGTYSNSVKAGERISKEFEKPIYVIDSKNLSGALGLLVLKAAQKIGAGESVESIVNTLKKDVLQSKIFVSVRDLQSMIRGGRVSRPKGIIASALGLNPVISMDKNGKSLLFGNTFSQQASLKKIFKHIEQISRRKTIWNYIILHAHNSEGAQLVESKMFEMTGIKPVSVVNISPVIGMHAGNGALAVSLLFNN
ncbi:DegV family EDD domain-containing protein [Ancylomarina euxinus]|uniref:DegV family EDD domain-containing protein n=1 Tax=Ancylomarina euxinus TaxID=2283627 RepID=A0A425Y483_9BACT|nr:DegV family protein [Ancylomarina euxinus]MCZ4694679.1 DegV family EDD domain-containing protein [Ancylomarina euxinus]MUP14223.1 DegV family EDD domain-containing protein [Ancylomarina euxinus]RRG23074.1 DegV family EDD domain-containing protein [Ancylomarina euxinus]